MLRACLAALVLLAGCGSVDGEPGVAEVREVIDGDTLVVRVGRGNETVRLLGIDTPETKHPTKPIECFGPEASDHLAALLPRGTRVTLTRDTEARDHFGRLLAFVVREADGLFVNLAMLEGGYARLLVIEPNVALRSQLARAEDVARRTGAGLWGGCQR